MSRITEGDHVLVEVPTYQGTECRPATVKSSTAGVLLCEGESGTYLRALGDVTLIPSTEKGGWHDTVDFSSRHQRAGGAGKGTAVATQ